MKKFIKIFTKKIIDIFTYFGIFIMKKYVLVINYLKLIIKNKDFKDLLSVVSLVLNIIEKIIDIIFYKKKAELAPQLSFYFLCF